MTKRTLLVSMLGGLLFLFSISYAVPLVYTLNYKPNTASTAVSLKNTDVQLQLFADGNPRGTMNAHTDSNQSVMLNSPYDKTLVVAVLGIEGSPKTMVCQGISQIGKTDILIECRNR